QNLPFDKLKLDNKTIKFIESKTKIAKFDFSLEIIPASHTINLEYCTDLFKKQTIEKFIVHYLQTLENMYNDINTKVKDISILTDIEKDYLLNDFNNTYLKYPHDETISTLFEKQVKKSPKDLALVFMIKHLHMM